MKTKSKEMTFTRDELQYIVNGLNFSITAYGDDIETFKDIMDLTAKFNEELDEFTAQDAELFKRGEE